MQEMISVVVPVYNVKNYLERCLQAICNQTYQNLQIILVDDGATDGSGEICDRYAKQDSRIRVIHKKNGGTSSARNVGIKAATGKYIGFLDADDWAELDLYENLYQAITKEPKVKVAQMMSRNYTTDGKLVCGPQRDDGKVVDLMAKDFLHELLLHIGDSSFCTKLIDREWMQKFSFSENKLNEDFELLLTMIPELECIRTIGKVGYNINLSDGSNTRGKFKQNLYVDMLENAEKARRLVEESYPEFTTEVKKFWMVQTLDFMLHIPVDQMKKENEFYWKIKNELKQKKKEISSNPYLDGRQRKNLKILATCPKTARWVHGILMRLRSDEG